MLAGRNGARGRIRTCTGDVLDIVSLLVGLREQKKWSLPPVLPRHDFLTKEVGSASARRPKMAGRAVARRAKAGRSPRCRPGHSGRMLNLPERWLDCGHSNRQSEIINRK